MGIFVLGLLVFGLNVAFTTYWLSRGDIGFGIGQLVISVLMFVQLIAIGLDILYVPVPA